MVFMISYFVNSLDSVKIAKLASYTKRFFEFLRI